MFKYSMGFYDNDPTFTYYRERLLRRENHNQWLGFVHEVIIPKGKIYYSDIEIEHRKLEQSNPKRNLKLYNINIKKGYELNSREQYYYSRELYYNNYLTKAIKELKKYLKSKDKYTPNIIGAYLILADIYLQKSELAKAKKTLFECVSLYLPNPEICCKIAEIFDKENNMSQAIFWYNSALLSPTQTDGFIQKDYEEFIPYMELSRLYYKLDNYKKAKEYFLLSKKVKPKHPAVIYNQQFFTN